MDVLNLPADITYMRWYKEGKVHRVALCSEGQGFAFYPTPNKDVFTSEYFEEVDDKSIPKEIPRDQIKDSVLISLLEGQPIEQILARFKEFAGFHVHLPANDNTSRHFNMPTFRIVDEQEEAAI